MIINQSQATLLHNLRDEIETQLGYKIGYSSMWGSFVDDDDDFVIYEEGYFHEDKGYPDAEIITIHFIHRQDFESRGFILVKQGLAKFPLHDEACEQFWKKLHHSMEGGAIIRNPKHTKDFGNLSVKVIKMANERFDVWIDYNGHSFGTMSTLEELKADSSLQGQEQVLETIAELEQLISLGEV
jgi:hypothetical protein